MNELVKLGKGIPMPSETMKSGAINLTDREVFDDRKRADGQNQSPYDRWLELIGQTPLEKELHEIIKSEEYTELSDELRLAWVSSVVKDRQEEAFEQVKEEYPQLADAVAMEGEVRDARRAGGNAAVKDVMSRYKKAFVRVKMRPNPAMPD